MRWKIIIPVLLGSAVLCGLVFAGPQWFIKKAVESRGLTYLASQYTTETNELEMDLPRAREIYDGHFPPSELFSAGFGPSLLNPIPVLILSAPMFLAGGNINLAYLLNQFVFGALVFLAFCLLGWAITGELLWSWLFGFVGALTPLARYLPRAFSGFGYFLDLAVKNFYPLVQSPLELLFLHKVVDPLITFLIYVPAIALLIWFWKKPSKLSAILAAATTGILFYTYWHYWVYLVTVWIWLGIYSLWQRKADPQRFRWVLVAAATLVLVALPYFVNYFIFNHGSFAKEIVARYGVIEYGRYIQFSPIIVDYIFYLVTSLLIYLVFWKQGSSESRSMAVIFWVFDLAAVCVWNLQLITGFTLTANHWWLAYAPAGLIIVFSTGFVLSERLLRNKKALKIVLVILIALLMIKKIVNVFEFVNPSDSIIQKYSFNPGIVAGWDWLNKNAGPEPKVVSPILMDSVYLTIYTSARPYLPFYTNTLVSDVEIEERFLRAEKLFGVTRENLEKELRWASVPSGCKSLAEYFHSAGLVCDNHTRFSFENGRFLYGFKYQRKDYSTVGDHIPSWNIPEEKIGELLRRYDALKVSWKDLGSDYVFYSQWGRNLSDVNLKIDPGLELVYQNSAVGIYKIKR